MDLLDKKIKPARVLEIGIGNGRLIKLLSNTVSQYDGLDISQNIINKFIEKNSWYVGIKEICLTKI